MSISYWVNLDWPKDVSEIVEVLASQPGFAIDADRVCAAPARQQACLKSDHFYVSVTKSTASWRQMLSEDLRVDICIDIIFLVGDSYSTIGNGGLELTRMVGLLLQHTMRDFVFLFNGEKVLLIRESSGLFIDSDAGFWNVRNQEILGSFANFGNKLLPTI